METGLIVELKVVSALADEHRAQVLNYLRVTRKSVGYLINFAAFPNIEWQRLINTRPKFRLASFSDF